MSEHTDLFLAGLSHRWSGHVLAATVLSGIAVYAAGLILARCRAGGDVRRIRLAKAGRAVCVVLFVLSLPVLGISVLHLGCAGLKGHATQCMSNVKQLATAALTYSQDYDERFPPAARWSEAIVPAITKSQAGASSSPSEPADVFGCPAADTPASYGMNAAIGSASPASFAAPQETALLFDADAPTRSFSGGERDVAWERHSESPYIGFVDGHAKSVRRGYGAGNVTWTAGDPDDRDPKRSAKPLVPISGLRR